MERDDARDRPVGLTRDAGWNAGARRTIPARADTVWHALLAEALPLWFGTPEEPLEFLRVPPIARGEGASGEIRGAEAGRRLRFTRAFGESPDSTTVQLTVLPGTDRDDDRVHEERLAGPAERAESIREWKAALARIASAFEGSAPDRAEEEES